MQIVNVLESDLRNEAIGVRTRMGLFATTSQWLARNRARNDPICIVRHHGEFWGPKASAPLCGSGLAIGLKSVTEGVVMRGVKRGQLAA